MTDVKAFIEALEDAGFDVHSYSGRGMYGKQCVSVHDGSAWEIAKMIGEEFSSVPEPRSDSLGLGVVLYWPSLKWPEDEGGKQ